MNKNSFNLDNKIGIDDDSIILKLHQNQYIVYSHDEDIFIIVLMSLICFRISTSINQIKFDYRPSSQL